MDSKMYLVSILLSPLIAVGLVGNCLSILTWMRGRHRRTSTALLLTALAFFSILVLLLPALEYWIQDTWGRDTDFHRLRNLNLPMCKMLAFSSYFGPTTMSWILVFVTFERVISMWFPIRVRYMCTRFKVCTALVVLVFMTAVMYAPFIYASKFVTKVITSGSNGEISSNITLNNATLSYGVTSAYNLTLISNQSSAFNVTETKRTTVECDIYISSAFFREYFIIWLWLDLCLLFLFPFILIVIGNVLILWKLMRRKKLLSRDGKAITCRTRVANAFTVRAIALSITFCLSTCPVTIYALMRRYTSYDNRHENHLVDGFINILFYANSSVNFFLYCAIGSGFKRDLRTVLRNLCRSKRISIPFLNTSHYNCDDNATHV